MNTNAAQEILRNALEKLKNKNLNEIENFVCQIDKILRNDGNGRDSNICRLHTLVRKNGYSMQTVDTDKGCLITVNTGNGITVVRNEQTSEGAAWMILNEFERMNHFNGEDVNTYQKLAFRTATDKADINNVCFGLAGEVGEVCDAVKKYKYHGHEEDSEHLKKELGDVCWYIALGCTLLHIDMSQILYENIKKLEERYPNGFSTEKSINRADGDV